MVRSGERKPEEIKKDVYSQLIWDTRVNESDINVEVSDGKVVLTGLVPTCPDRLEAEDDAYAVSGVRYVDNGLRVSYPPSFPTPRDPDIASKVRSLLEWNPNIDSKRIDVAVDCGQVTLMGSVGSIWQKYNAEHITENVSGVIGVRNQLKVEPPRTVTDEDIRTDIISSLVRNSFPDVTMVNVHVKDSIVTLSGTVNDYFECRTAEDIARYTNGVVDVNNNLVIA